MKTIKERENCLKGQFSLLDLVKVSSVLILSNLFRLLYQRTYVAVGVFQTLRLTNLILKLLES